MHNNQTQATGSVVFNHQFMIDDETMYMNMHILVFPDTNFSAEKIDAAAKKNNALGNYTIQALVNVIFPSKLDAMSFYKQLNE